MSVLGSACPIESPMTSVDKSNRAQRVQSMWLCRESVEGGIKVMNWQALSIHDGAKGSVARCDCGAEVLLVTQ